jgi:hypothetical protein
MMPLLQASLSDCAALGGIAIVASALLVSVLARATHGRIQNRIAQTGVGLLLVALGAPWGADALPLASFVRGVTSDFSVSTVCWAALVLSQGLFGRGIATARERTLAGALVLATAIFLYPAALGWGDWDPYRLGWGSPALLMVVLLAAAVSWAAGLRWLPVAIASAVLAWSAGLMESGNLWDYLIDPWLAGACLLQAGRCALRRAAPSLLPFPPRKHPVP